jgi:histidine triad (HIT) family protein
MQDDCIFCKIARGEVRELDYEDGDIVVFPSSEPVAKHHYLVVPKLHVENFMELSGNPSDLPAKMVAVAQKIIKDKNIQAGYKLVINGGKYLQVNHLHLHILGGEINKEAEV